MTPTIEEEALADGVSIALLRNKLGIDCYSSEESLNSSVLDYKVYGSTMNLMFLAHTHQVTDLRVTIEPFIIYYSRKVVNGSS